MLYSFGRSDPSRPSSFCQRAQLRERVSRWRSSHQKSFSDIESPLLLSPLFKPCLDLLDKSRNLVFFDRGLKQVREFPYPLTQRGCPVAANGFSKYFKGRRLRFECFCGLKEDDPQFLEVKVGPFGHFMSCEYCGLYLSIEKFRATADKFTIYPPSDPFGAVKPVTLSTEGLKNEAQSRPIRRSQRRISEPGYDNYRRQYLAQDVRGRSLSPVPVEDLFKRERSSSPVRVEELLGSSQVASGSRIKPEDIENDALTRSSEKYGGIKFCRFCNNGMLEEDIDEHETECWLVYSPSVASTRRTMLSAE